MAVHPIVIAGDPVLHRPCAKVTEFDEKLRELVADMYETNTAANGVGLAANQIGVDLSVFIYDCPDYEAEHADPHERRRGAVVNPVLETSGIPETMPDPEDDWEGCLSVPGESYPTGRADWAKVTGFDTEGAPIEVEGTGYFARCLQHETDHLNGFLYLDRLVGRHRRDVKRMLKRHGWGVPGNSWKPGEVPDPFNH